MGTSVVLALLILAVTTGFTELIVGIFNSENNGQMAAYAMQGVKIYFWGFLFAGINIVGAGYLSAIEEAGWAFAISMIRGVVAISICAFVLAHFLGMTGIWLAFPTAEFITVLVMVRGMKRRSRADLPSSTNNKGKNAVLISEADWKAIEETLYQLWTHYDKMK